MRALLEKHSTPVLMFCLAILTLAVFFQVTGHEFLNYDDNLYVAENPHVRGGLTGENFAWAFTTFRAANWHPLTWISLQFDASVFGTQPMGFHLTNLLLHIANVLLLFLLLSRVTGHVWRSAFAAALFAIHPLHVESVAWVAERKDVLSTLFWLLTMLAYVQYARKPSAGRYAAVGVLFALGLMAKPMLVTLPLILLLMDYWPLGRFSVGRKNAPPTSRLFYEKIPLLALSIGSCAVTFVAQQEGGAVASVGGVPVGLRVGNAIVSCAAYIVKMVYPAKLAVFYPYSASLPAWEIAASVLLIGGISYLAYRLRASRPYLAVGWLWYLITLIPVIGLVQVGQQSMADRYTYVPLIGLFVALTWLVGQVRRVGLVGLAAVIVLAGLSWRQVGFWKDNNTLFTHALAVTENNHMAHANLGVALYDAGKFEGALDHFRQAVEIKPNEAVAQCSLGTVFMKLNRADEAIEHLETAVRLNNGLSEAHNNLGVLYGNRGDFEKAADHYREAVRTDPDSADAYFNLAVALNASGRPKDAVEAYLESINLRPDDPAAHNNLGAVYARLGRKQEAVSEFREALRLDPDNASARENLDKALSGGGGEREKAAAESALGDEAMRGSRWNEAIEHYSRVLEILPERTLIRNNLAAAYYFAGMYDKAWEQIRLCRKYGGTPKPELIRLLSEKMPEPR